jgi:hypothetical protein
VHPYCPGASATDNLDPVGGAYYAILMMLCTPNALSQKGGELTLGPQAREARLRQALTAGRFTRVRCAAEMPFTLVLEARV